VATYKEIVTKAVIGKGKKYFKNKNFSDWYLDNLRGALGSICSLTVD